MTIFTTAPDVILLGRETIYRNGVRVGWLSSVGFGHTIGKSMGMGFVCSNQVIDRDFILVGAPMNWRWQASGFPVKRNCRRSMIRKC